MNATLQFGPRLQADGVTFRLWAPKARQVELLADGVHPMVQRPGGWHEVMLAGGGAGTRYKFRIDSNLDVPDPASHFQPEDVSGPSAVIDHAAFRWRARDWRGRPWQEAVTLEC